MQKKYATGRPDQKDLNENLAATQGLAHMITECNRLFEVRHIHTSISHEDNLTLFQLLESVFHNKTFMPTINQIFYWPFQLSLLRNTNCFIFPQIPHEMVTQSRNSYVEAELQAPTIEELCKQQHQEEEGEDEGSWPAFIEARLQGLLKESREKAKGWVSCQSTGNTELSYKKV